MTTYSLDPGPVSTDLLRYQPWVMAIKPYVLDPIFYILAKDSMGGAQTQICCAVDPALGNESGKYYR